VIDDLEVGEGVGVAVQAVQAVQAMNELHVELARKAARLAMSVLEGIDVNEIPVASAVALLKFGVDLERKALLGTEDDVEADPFAALADAMKPVKTEPMKTGPEGE